MLLLINNYEDVISFLYFIKKTKSDVSFNGIELLFYQFNLLKNFKLDGGKKTQISISIMGKVTVKMLIYFH